ncbi:inorganic diphosphatase [Adhaeribacter aquaticus]|uniref:inorganic diphosphatase n=1 Tax=Adhaeribacter aquaticus TaxID=299567 RepID=UPI0004185E04|nr:inorganic diphosphatase [Adhaeribacter aquaticus]
MAPLVHNLPLQDAESGLYHVIIETPKGSRNKYVYNEQFDLYQLRAVLPAGASFPYDFGFIPSTLGEDGDPVDVLLLMDEPVYPGCLVQARLLGVIAVEQTKDGNTLRNDRILAVSAVSKLHQLLQDIKDLDKNLLDQIEHFFRSYNASRGQQFEVIGRYGVKKAEKLVSEGSKLFEQNKQAS